MSLPPQQSDQPPHGFFLLLVQIVVQVCPAFTVNTYRRFPQQFHDGARGERLYRTMMDAESRITVQAYRGDIERTTGIAAIVNKIRPVKKSKKAKIMKGKKGGSKSIMNRGTEINNQATAPQNARPRDTKTINFFFVDSSMSFIHSLSANRCFTWHMLYALRAGWYLDRREGNKKSAARKGQAALLLKLALDAPLSRKVVERTLERSTDTRELRVKSYHLSAEHLCSQTSLTRSTRRSTDNTGFCNALTPLISSSLISFK